MKPGSRDHSLMRHSLMKHSSMNYSATNYSSMNYNGAEPGAVPHREPHCGRRT
jgi:hypothetical protein